MKKIVFLILLFSFTVPVFADHLKGGWIYYEYLGNGTNPNTSRYKITVKQYMRCTAMGGQLDQEVFLGIFDGGSNQLLQTITLQIAGTNTDNKTDFSCITGAPVVCYRIDQYVGTIELPDNAQGYILSVQRCCRISGIVNVLNSSTIGITYTNTIPGIINGQSYRNNSSPVFAQKDTVIVCHDASIIFDFSATDADGDSLSYSFIDGISGGNSGGQNGARPNPPTMPPPPYSNAVIPYSSGFSGTSPLGSRVTIDSRTGIISGIAPGAIGTYVVAVTANEYRGGVLIGRTRKEIHIDVADCQLTAAQLIPKYISCDGFSLTFKNEATTPPGSIFTWTFGDPASGANNISTTTNPTHVYSDTGVYNVKLKITSAAGCEDSATTLAYVYPFFSPGFISTGQCKNTQIQFTDTTKTTYGTVNTWSWNFGDTGAGNTSALQNPTHTYSVAGNYQVSLTATSSKGCSNTVTQTIAIKDKPDLTVTNDTLICSIDTLQLNAVGAGTISWTPNYNINNQSSASPLVSPDVPTMYYVTLQDPFGCKATDSVFVDVKQFVTLNAGRDTGICAGDVIQLTPISDALQYQWSPASALDNATIKNPLAAPTVTTTFYVIGNIGKCQSTDSIRIRVAPYPGAVGMPDTAICIGSSIQLNASGGSLYTWSPPFFLNDPNIPNPIANPDRSIQYIVTIRDTLGCPKPALDTVIVRVERVIADAGPRDTSIVINQPLQLNGTGGEFYLWTPPTGLDNPAIANPVATLSDDMEYIVRVSTAAGCFATDTISIKVFKVLPGIYVPNAFTPNGDGKNDVFRPVAIGMKQINYFKVFNRWGVLVYSSNNTAYDAGNGWDGAYKGTPQSSAVFVWIVEGVDYLDKKITQKGIVTLIR